MISAVVASAEPGWHLRMLRADTELAPGASEGRSVTRAWCGVQSPGRQGSGHAHWQTLETSVETLVNFKLSILASIKG